MKFRFWLPSVLRVERYIWKVLLLIRRVRMMSACLLYVKSSNKVLNSGLLSPLFHSLSLTFDHHQIAPYIFKIDLAAKSMWFFNPEIGNKSAKVVNNWNRQPDYQRFFSTKVVPWCLRKNNKTFPLEIRLFACVCYYVFRLNCTDKIVVIFLNSVSPVVWRLPTNWLKLRLFTWIIRIE